MTTIAVVVVGGTFRKRPVEIQALRLLWSTWGEMCDFAGVGSLTDGKPEGTFLHPDGTPSSDYPGPEAKIGLAIPTLEGVMIGTEGDWIIRGVAGELYPCKPDIFRQSYEWSGGEPVYRPESEVAAVLASELGSDG